MGMWTRANKNINLAQYSTVCDPECLWSMKLSPPKERQYILRMMIACPGHKVCIPNELEWLRDLIAISWAKQLSHKVVHPFIYVTVRHGEVTSTTDDDWHADGFSTRISHNPEQNYIWSSNPSTEFLRQSFNIPEDFDPLRHNLHWYFQDRANEKLAYSLDPETVVLIDPYVIHRRPKVKVGTTRTFVRISFVPIEIRDDVCTPNSLLPAKRYGTGDFRHELTRFTAR